MSPSHAYDFRQDPRSARVVIEDGKMRKAQPGGRPPKAVKDQQKKEQPKTVFARKKKR